jgi:hypothetical protein
MTMYSFRFHGLDDYYYYYYMFVTYMFETLPINLYSVLSIPLSLLLFVPGLLKLSTTMRDLGQTFVTICKLMYLKQKHSVTAIVAFY